MKKFLILILFTGCWFSVHAQQTLPSAETADSLIVPLKYSNIHRRILVLACALSLYIPGLGQIYNKQVLKGGIVFGVAALSLGSAEVYHADNGGPKHHAVTAALLAPLIAAYLYAAIDKIV
jgi:hypothetical protein